MDAIFQGRDTNVRRPKALFLDACGTFLVPSEAVTDVYRRYAKVHGVPEQHLADHRILEVHFCTSSPHKPRVESCRFIMPMLGQMWRVGICLRLLAGCSSAIQYTCLPSSPSSTAENAGYTHKRHQTYAVPCWE